MSEWFERFFKGFLFSAYYDRVANQAEREYLTSDLYCERYLKNGPEFANRYSGDDIAYFVSKSHEWPWPIRLRLLRDAFLNAPMTSYYFRKSWIKEL